RGSNAACRIPDEICVYGHIVITRVELGETVALIDSFWAPFAFRQLAKRACGKTQDRCDALQGLLIDIAFAQFADRLQIDARFFFQSGIRNAQTALRFSDDITNVVFERDHILWILSLKP